MGSALVGRAREGGLLRTCCSTATLPAVPWTVCAALGCLIGGTPGTPPPTAWCCAAPAASVTVSLPPVVRASDGASALDVGAGGGSCSQLGARGDVAAPSNVRRRLAAQAAGHAEVCDALEGNYLACSSS